MKITLILGFSFLFLAQNVQKCEDKSSDNQYPPCLQKDIDRYLADNPQPREAPGKIYNYTYNGKEVFVFDPGSNYADWLFEIVDANCNIICKKGGYTGMDTCPDFDDKADFKGIVWQHLPTSK